MVNFLFFISLFVFSFILILQILYILESKKLGKELLFTFLIIVLISVCVYGIFSEPGIQPKNDKPIITEKTNNDLAEIKKDIEDIKNMLMK